MAEINVAETVKKIVVENLERKLGADSLDITEVIMALEEEFGIDIDDDANQIETVGDAIQYIEGKLRA